MERTNGLHNLGKGIAAVCREIPLLQAPASLNQEKLSCGRRTNPGRCRRNRAPPHTFKRYSPKFKFTVVLEVLKGEKSDAEVARAFDVH